MNPSASSAGDIIRNPEDLGLPPEADEVFAALSEEGARSFSKEIIHALLKAQSRGNFRPVKDVVEAWYRTLQFVKAPDHRDAAMWARQTRKKEGLTAEEVAAELGV